MSEENNPMEGTVEKDTDTSAPLTAEEKIAARVQGAITGEVDRLENLAHRFLGEDRIKDHCQVVETLASIKGRAEMYCIQLEMAMQTAAMASVLNSAMRQGAAQQEGEKLKDIGDITEVVRRAKRPSSNS